MENEDKKNLDLLAMFHFILAGVTAFFSCFPFIHVFVGLAIVMGKLSSESEHQGPPLFFGLIFAIMGAIFIVLGWSLAVVLVIAGKKLKQRRSRMFCMVVAGIECAFMPLGTVLGVFTIITLNKDSVKQLFTEIPQGTE